MHKIKEPTQRISLDAIKVWRIADTLNTSLFLGALFFLLFLHHYYNWSSWISIVIYSLMGLTVISTIIEIIVIPIYKQKTWRYEFDSYCIQLKHGGAIKKTHMIIPMDKVYFVDTYQGPLLQRYKLSTIKIGTVGYIHEIPGIPEKKAAEIRDNISFLSGISSGRKDKGGA